MEQIVPFPVLRRFLGADCGIDAGPIDALDYAAVACEADSVRVGPDRSPGDALHELLQRLNDPLDACLRTGQVFDEFSSGPLATDSIESIVAGA